MAKKITCVTFDVTGSGSFPFDMLRYDGCFPASEGESGKIEGRGPRTVRLRSDRPTEPTAGRWDSFGWKVSNIETRR